MITLALDTVLGTLFSAYRKTLDEAAITLYERGLVDVSVPLVDAAVTRAIRTRTFLPTIAELRQDAEACRQELLARHPYQRCEACRDAGGFVPVTDEGGVVRLAKCPCFHAYRGALARLGVSERPVLVLTAAGVGEEAW